MKTKDFLEILKHLRFVFNDNNYIDEANYIYFDVNNKAIYTYSDSLTYIHWYKGNMEKDFNLIDNVIALPAKDVYSLINKLKKEEVAISQQEDVVVFRYGRSSTKFKIASRVPDENRLKMHTTEFHKLPEMADSYKKYILHTKNDSKCDNIILNPYYIASSDNYTITVVPKESASIECAVHHSVLKHISSLRFNKIAVKDDVIQFNKDGYSLICKNKIDNVFPLAVFDNMMGELKEEYNIYIDKDEDISFLDAVLLNYKKPDQKVVVSIHGNRMVVVAENENKTNETRASLKLKEHEAGVNVSFKINVEYFKQMYENFDYFQVLDGIVYCYNVEDEVQRIIRVENL